MEALFIGDNLGREFAAACQWLAASTSLSLATSPDQAEALIAANASAPRLIVLAQSRPGEISHAQVEHLHRLAPLARLVALLGSWCEGETRSGHPWAGVMRLYWHEFVPRMARLLACPSGWNLPRTSTDAERLLATPASRNRAPRGIAAIIARRRETFLSLAEGCETSGLAGVWIRPGAPSEIQGTSVVLWESSGWGPFEASELACFAARFAPAPIVALVDFPRLAEREEILVAGASAVVPKPFLLEDLLWRLDEMLGATPRLAFEEAA